MFKIQRLAGLLVVSLAVAFPALAQAPHSFPFRATNYDVEVILHPDDQNITATVKADFVAEQVSKTVVVELHPDLKIATVHEPGGQAARIQPRHELPAADHYWTARGGVAGEKSDAAV